MRRSAGVWASVLLMTGACGGSKPGGADAGATPVNAATGAPGTTGTSAAGTGVSAGQPDATADTAAPVKPSRLAEAEALLAKEFLAKDAVAMADALAAETTPAAAAAGARLRLGAVALATMQHAGAEALGDGGFEKQLRLALAGAEKAGDAGTLIALAARSLLVLPNLVEKAAAETAPPLKEMRRLFTDPSIEAIAFRVAAAQQLQTHTQAVGPGAFERFLGAEGALFCEGCRGAGKVPPEQLGELVNRTWDEGGLACPADAKSPVCTVLATFAKDGVATAPNTLTVVALALADALRKAPEAGPLAAAFRPLGDAVLGPVALPVPVAALDAAWGTGTLGTGDMSEAQAALLVARIDAKDVQIGGRPVVKSDGSSWTAELGVRLEDAPVVALATLLETAPDPKTGEVAGVSDRAMAVAGTLGAAPAKPGESAAVALAADPGTPVAAVARLAEGLAAAKLTLRVLRPKTPGAVLPLWTGDVPLELRAKLVPGWERATLVEVAGDHIDVWCAEKAKDGAAPVKADRQGQVPGFAKQGWRGETLVRLRVPLPAREKDAPFVLAPEVLDQVAEAARFFEREAKTGLLVELVAGGDLPVGPVLELARALQENGGDAKREGPSLGDVAETGAIWPGVGCDVGKKACASAVVVAFSRAAVPSGKGLTEQPGKKKEKEDKPPEVPKGPEPSAEFCNKADMQAQMRKKAGDFRFCYERELQLEKDLQGRLSARFTIDLAGHVKGVGTSGDLPSAKVAECIKKAIAKIQFAPPDGGECVVNWPFVFKN